MKGTVAILVLVVPTLLMGYKQSTSQDQTSLSPAHVRNTFRFEVAASIERAAPLFGPEGERCWAGQSWNPEFLHPLPPKDIEGAVFTVQHGQHKSVWVNTVFDLSAGRMQYVSFIPGALVSTIDVRMTAVNPTTTSVEVTYARTALSTAANEDVATMARRDLTSGPHWQEAIQSCLERQARPSVRGHR